MAEPKTPAKRTRKGLLGVPVEDRGVPPRARSRRPSGPKDIDDDQGRRPALTYGEWRASKDPAPTVKARAGIRHHIEPVTGPAGQVPGTARGTAPVPARRRRRIEIDRAAAVEQGNQLANRQAYMAAHTKPSVTGRAIGGGVGGASSGAAVAGPVGAGVGAAIGTVGGGVSGARAKRQYKRATARPNPAKRILLAELAICAVIGALAPVGAARKDEAPGAWMKRMAAILGLFFVLGLVSAMGRGGAKVAAGFGGLVTVVLLVSKRDVFVALAKKFGSTSDPGQGGPGPSTAVDTASMAGGRQLGSTEVNPTGAGGSPSKQKPRRVR